MERSLVKLLLVEDDEDDYLITRDLLSEIERSQFVLEWVTTYDAALVAIERSQPDIILVDYYLGGHTGLELLRTISARDCKAPVILLTGLGDYEVDTEAIQAGAADYLVKGQINASLLDRSLRHAIERKRAEEALRESETRFRELARRKELLNRLAKQIRTSLDLNTILKTAVTEIRQLLQIHRCRFLWYRIVAGATFFEPVCEAWDCPDGITSNPLRGAEHLGETVLQLDLMETDGISTDLPTSVESDLDKLGFPAFMLVPIRTQVGRIGAVVCEHWHDPRAWKEEELDLLRSVADQLAIAVEQAVLYEQSRTAAATAQAQAQQALGELQQAQAQLIQTEKMSSLGQLVAGVAHEINNPVNFIHGNITPATHHIQNLLHLFQLYQQHYPQPVAEIESAIEALDLDFLLLDLPKVLASMRVGAERIHQIVLSLRNFARLDESEIKEVDIHEGLNNALLLLQHRLHSESDRPAIDVVKDYVPLPLVQCYAGQLNQVFMNILTNAIDALEERLSPKTSKFSYALSPAPCIRVQTEQKGDRIIIRIADNGSGISEAAKQRLFDPFFTTKPAGKGTGLGLAISYQIIVKRHEGKLNCFSTPGQGTEFVIEIPRICSYQGMSKYPLSIVSDTAIEQSILSNRINDPL